MIAFCYLVYGVTVTVVAFCSYAVMVNAARTGWRRHRTRAADRAELAARNRALQVTGTVHCHTTTSGR